MIKRLCCKIKPLQSDKEREKELEFLKEHNPNCVPLAPWEKEQSLETFTFKTFVDDFMTQCDNIHWRPQCQRMSDSSWKYINFWGKYDRLHEDAHQLLERIGAWEEFGSSGWGKDGNLSLFEKPLSTDHATNSHDKMFQFYTPKLLKKVFDFVKDDYESPWFNLSLPDFVYNISGTHNTS
jgi:hypothetical protein